MQLQEPRSTSSISKLAARTLIFRLFRRMLISRPGATAQKTANQTFTDGAEIACLAGMKSPKDNKALVLEAFDTLFNKRDYAKAAEFWSPNYIQHSAHIPQGVTACSAWSALCRTRCITRTTLSWRKGTM